MTFKSGLMNFLNDWFRSAIILSVVENILVSHNKKSIDLSTLDLKQKTQAMHDKWQSAGNPAIGGRSCFFDIVTSTAAKMTSPMILYHRPS